MRIATALGLGLEPGRLDLRRALVELATSCHTSESLQASLGRSLAGYLLEQDLAESRTPDRVGLSDAGWSRYVEEVVDP